jgi:hypothetical protein
MTIEIGVRGNERNPCIQRRRDDRTDSSAAAHESRGRRKKDGVMTYDHVDPTGGRPRHRLGTGIQRDEYSRCDCVSITDKKTDLIPRSSPVPRSEGADRVNELSNACPRATHNATITLSRCTK